MTFDVERVACVVGGAGGIGSAASTTLRNQSFRIVVADLDSAAAGRVARDLDSSGRTAVAETVDVYDSESVNDLFLRVQKTFSRLDALINCAGDIGPRSSDEVSDDEWAHLIGVHLDGTFRCCRAAFPALKRSAPAAIVNVSSINAHLGYPGRASYSAAKAGIEALTRTLAVEWAPHGIRVNAVAPGHTWTPLVERAIADGFTSVKAIAARVPLGRLATSSEIAACITFLACEESSYVTGHTLVVDGGMMIDGRHHPTGGGGG